jgi:uncharacterized membrane protein YtjA (UPF0391 family)
MGGAVWVVVFLVLGIISGILGFAGIAGTSTWIVQLLFFLFLTAFIVKLLWERA